MVDEVLASRAQTASVSERAESASSRATSSAVSSADNVSRLPELSQRAFGVNFAKPATNLPGERLEGRPERKDPVRSGNGLLATEAQILLAETRSQEAAATFYPPSRVGRALNVYLETQSQVRDTIRAATSSLAGNSALSSSSGFSADTTPAAYASHNAEPEAGLGADNTSSQSLGRAPIDSSIDDV